MMIMTSLRLVIFVFSALVSLAATAKDQIYTIETRQGVRQTFLVVEPGVPPQAAVVMFPGGPGAMRIKKIDEKITLYENGFLQRTRNQFAGSGIVVAIVDVPSDQKELWRDF